ncbi:MAG TPA: IS200/IS605 family transposase [Candidatus Sulfomarinibacteraceae bacterium]|nr:IS200/IS605 family transposase [Candidatus Sulfomarinibacteraceae bacterium]
MPFWRTYYHLVWATKNRAPLIVPDVELELHGYLISKAREIGVRVYALNGWVDHVHLIVSIPPKSSVADVVKRLKGASAFHVNQLLGNEGRFAWQRGYGVLTLGERQRGRAEAYVHQQKEHHRRKTTNQWLERMDEFDEGPPDEGLDGAPPVAGLREERVVYDVEMDGAAFPF